MSLDPIMFGRAAEVAAIEQALSSRGSPGLVIEGEIGAGKTLLARSVFRRRGKTDIWLRCDSALQTTDFGAFGLMVDLSADPASLLPRIVAELNKNDGPRTVFVDDAHYLDERSLGVLANLASQGAIALVALSRPPTSGEYLPFSDLVDEHVLEHIKLGPLTAGDCRNMIEHVLGGIISQGVIEIVDFHTGRNPGRLRELLENAIRKRGLLSRRGVWLLDGLDIDYDERARDFTRFELASYTQDEREALELVVLAGEVDIELMLSSGLGAAADSLVSRGEFRMKTGTTRAYVSVENRIAETVRFTIPMGRSRQEYERLVGAETLTSSWARVLRTDWGLRCGAVLGDQRLVDSAREAAQRGHLHLAKRLLAGLPTERMSPHELFDLARLYCDTNLTPIGLDVLAQCVRRACCPQLVLDALVVWMNRDFGQTSPMLTLSDFETAIAEAEFQPAVCLSPEIPRDTVRGLFNGLQALTASTPFDDSVIRGWAPSTELPKSVRILVSLLYATTLVDEGRGDEALGILAQLDASIPYEGAGMLYLRMLTVWILIQLGQTDRAKALLSEVRSHDVAYLAARSGPSDLLWAQIHMLEGRPNRALRALQSSVEALQYWQQTGLLAIALAEAEYATSLNGMLEAAADYRSRFDALPSRGFYQDYRRARILRIVARWLTTSEPRYEDEMRRELLEAQHDGAHGIEAFIRLKLFQHFGDADAAEMCRIAETGSGRVFDLLRDLGTALIESDPSALITFANATEASMPDLAARCRQLVERRRSSSSGEDPSVHFRRQLTTRERQISDLIVLGRTNVEIAHELGVRPRTVEGHAYRLFRKLGISQREQVGEALKVDGRG